MLHTIERAISVSIILVVWGQVRMAGKFFIFVLLIIIGCTPALQEDQATKGDAQKTSAAAKTSPAETAIVLGVRKEPVPPPPTGPRPKFVTPESYYEPVGPFFFYVETLTSTGPSNYGLTPTQPCIQSGVFKRGMRMVVRFEILDTKTGKRVTDKDLSLIHI